MHSKRTLIIVPVQNDESSLITLIRELAGGLADRALSLLVVDDGSIPPIDVVDVCVIDGRVITLSRNLGQQKAIAIGLAYAVANNLADVFVVMDADGEDRPGDVSRLLAALESGTESGPEFSVVVARRMKRSERLAFRAFYQLYRLLFFLLTGHRISFGNFSAIPIAAARRLVAMNELWVSFPATLIRSRLPIIELPTERGNRYQDQSRMNFVSLITLGFGAVSTFIESALTRIILVASGLVAVCVFASASAIVLKLVGMATPGWMTTVIGVSLILTIAVAILSFVGLALTILTGSQTVPAPSAVYSSFIARISMFGVPSRSAAPPVSDVERP
jgi:polyisoprenyl-phosphate glycosyltransferase